MLFTVQDVIGDRPRPVTAEAGEVLLSAYERMRQHDYSQLPVVGTDGRPIGVVTSNSILRALSHLGVTLKDLHVRDAMDSTPPEYRPGDDLFALLDELQATYAVLIVGADDKLIGIVTSYDTTEFFRRKNQNMMLLEDIETALKNIIRSAFSNEQGEADESALSTFIMNVADPRQAARKTAYEFLNRYISEAGGKDGLKLDKDAFEKVFTKTHPTSPPRALSDLTIYEFIRLIVHEQKRDYFQTILNFHPEVSERLLDGVRKTRNNVAHFRGTISHTESDRLNFCAEWLYRVRQALDSQRANQNPTTPQPQQEISSDALAPVEPEALEEAEQSDDSKYTPLALFLQRQGIQNQAKALTFSEIEKQIIRGKLPAAARQHPSWWSNDAAIHVQSRQWLEVGWRVDTVDLKSESVIFARIRERQQLYSHFYATLLESLAQSSQVPPRPSKNVSTSWIWTSHIHDGGRAVAHLGFSFAMGRRFRVELYIDSGNGDYNKRLFDALYDQHEAIEAELGGLSIQWERLNNKRATRVATYHEAAITDAAASLRSLQEWAVATMLRFQAAIEPRTKEAAKRFPL